MFWDGWRDHKRCFGMGGGIISECRRRHSVGESVGIVPQKILKSWSSETPLSLGFLFAWNWGVQAPLVSLPLTLISFFQWSSFKGAFLKLILLTLPLNCAAVKIRDRECMQRSPRRKCARTIFSHASFSIRDNKNPTNFAPHVADWTNEAFYFPRVKLTHFLPF